jgi:hypothetical protein
MVDGTTQPDDFAHVGVEDAHKPDRQMTTQNVNFFIKPPHY